MHANNSSDFVEKTELDQYLSALNLEELELVNREKVRSTKHLEGGPTIHGQKNAIGRVKIGNSIPKHMKTVMDNHEFGISSYHRGDLSHMHNVLSNEGMKD